MEGGKSGKKGDSKTSSLQRLMGFYHHSPFLLLKDILLLSLAVPGCISLWHSSVFSPRVTGGKGASDDCNCGASVAEAISMGCKYDALATAWLPKYCRDEELTAEFEKLGDGPNGEWTYWRDANHTQILPMQELRTG